MMAAIAACANAICRHVRLAGFFWSESGILYHGGMSPHFLCGF